MHTTPTPNQNLSLVRYYYQWINTKAGERKLRLKNKFSFASLLLILLTFLCFRCIYSENNSKNGYNATSWDAFGYYMYLPGQFIYHDVKELKWIPEVDKQYGLTGGNLYQAIALEQGGYTNRYLCGVAIMESPFFFLGHYAAWLLKEPQDGFSWPYQYAIMLSALFWCAVGFIFLRKILLTYFTDQVTGLTLLMLALTSNLIQYVSVDGGMSHAFIFALYALVIWLTLEWHKRPKSIWAFLLGFLCVLATISRPSELIIILIPLLWDTDTKETKNQKWAKVRQCKKQLKYYCLGGFIAALPQLVYWYYTTGSFVYDIGSKWYFLSPWFRVLFGSEKGWFIYTPVSVLMITGFFYMKNHPFRKSVITFCLLNIWIIISWSDWKYGASYSTRALVQSYPVFSLSLACLIHFLYEKGKEYFLYFTGIVLVILNFYQLSLYNKGILESFSPFF